MILGYEQKKRMLKKEKRPVVLERADIDFRKSGENLLMCGLAGMGKSELVRREIKELYELGKNILVFADNPEEYRDFTGVKQCSLSQLEKDTGDEKKIIYNKERTETLYIYIDSLDNKSKQQLNEIATLFGLSRYYKLVVSAVCCNHKKVINFDELFGLSKHFIQLPYEQKDLSGDIFTYDEKVFISLRYGRSIEEMKQENNRLIYKKAIGTEKIETFLVSDVFL